MARRNPRFFDKGLRGWIASYARKNYWRVAAWMDLDDLIAEGYLVYAICRARYDDRVENTRHFMALVKICFANQITDLANDRTAEPEIAVSQLGDLSSDPFESWFGGAEDCAELGALLQSAPPQIKRLIELAASPEWAGLLDMPLRRRGDGTRETLNDRLGRLLGLPRGALCIEDQLRRLLAGLDPNPEYVLIPHPARGVIRSWRA